MATPERPPSRINGKPNPAYTKWRREQKNASAVAEQEFHADPTPTTLATFLETTLPETLTLRVVKLARNARFVYCDLNGVKVPVKIKKGLQFRLLKKKIPIRKEGETYVHAP